MIALKRLKKGDYAQPVGRGKERNSRLQMDINDLTPDVIPDTCRVHFPDCDDLNHFTITVSPSEGLYKGGRFVFEVDVPKDYSAKPPKVRCKTRLWHPNINEEGSVCLSLLRFSLDTHGWTPARTLKEVVYGINGLFQDLLNWDDPLNPQAAEEHSKDEKKFAEKVSSYIRLYAQ